jgi:predicted PurR-regulated permease PerM
MNVHRPLPRLPAIIVLTGAMIACMIVLYLIAQPFIPALVWSLTLAVIFAPVERRLRSRTGSPGVAATATLLLAGIIVVIPLVTVASALMNEIIAGARSYGTLLSPVGLTRLRQSYPHVAALLDGLDRWLDFPQLLQNLTTQLGRWSGQLVQGSVSGIITLLLTFYFLFYFLRDKDKALASLERLVPLSSREFAEFTGKTVQTVFASVYATAAVAALQGLLGGLMFWILGLPSPAFWGVIMGLLAIVPFLGAFVIWVPAAIGLALGGHWLAAMVLAAWGTLVVGLIDNILYPILVGKRLSLHPMVSFIAIVGGLILFGAHGLVLGPLTVAVAQALLEIWRSRLDQEPRPVAEHGGAG